jgi:hypothetical protein
MRATLHIEATINEEELRALDFDMLNLDTTASRGELVERVASYDLSPYSSSWRDAFL